MAIEHCASAYEDGFDAWQFGYDDAMYDGIDMASELPCICLECLNKYHEGQEAAIKEIFAGKQSAQQSVQPTVLTHSPNCALVKSLVADCNCGFDKSHSG